MSTFVRKGAQAESLPTKLLDGSYRSIHNGQLLISSGLNEFDGTHFSTLFSDLTSPEIIGGGLPLGSLFLVEEDEFSTFYHHLVQYFLAEGSVSNQALFVSSASTNPEKILADIPRQAETTQGRFPLLDLCFNFQRRERRIQKNLKLHGNIKNTSVVTHN